MAVSVVPASHRIARNSLLLFLWRIWQRCGGVGECLLIEARASAKPRAHRTRKASLDVVSFVASLSSFWQLHAPSHTTAFEMNTLSIRAFIPPLTRRGLPLRAIRCYAVQAPGAPTMEIFSNQHKWMQKERAAANVEASRSVDYLRDEVASRLCERVLVRPFAFTSHPPPLTLPGHQPPLSSCP